MLTGRLPWQGVLNAQNKNDHVKIIGHLKKNTSFQVLCADLPEEFVTYFTYCKNLEFADEPDYSYLRSLFSNLATKLSYTYPSNECVLYWGG